MKVVTVNIPMKHLSRFEMPMIAILLRIGLSKLLGIQVSSNYKTDYNS